MILLVGDIKISSAIQRNTCGLIELGINCKATVSAKTCRSRSSNGVDVA
jgi:hypothetical protein